MVTLGDPYRRLASLRGVDRGGCAGPTRARSGRSVEVERPSVRVYGVSLKSVGGHFEQPLSQIGLPRGDDQGGRTSWFETKVVVLLR